MSSILFRCTLHRIPMFLPFGPSKALSRQSSCIICEYTTPRLFRGTRDYPGFPFLTSNRVSIGPVPEDVCHCRKQVRFVPLTPKVPDICPS